MRACAALEGGCSNSSAPCGDEEFAGACARLSGEVQVHAAAQPGLLSILQHDVARLF